MTRLEQYDAVSLPVKDIILDSKFNCRGEIDPQSCRELANSIRDIGLQMPIIVQPHKGGYKVVAGHRRFVAVSRLLRWETIPAIVREGLTTYDASILNLVENLERKDLTFIQEVQAYNRVFKNKTDTEAAKVLNKSSAWCKLRRKYPTLPKEVRDKFLNGILSTSDLYYLISFKPEARLSYARQIEEGKRQGKTSHQVHVEKGTIQKTRNRAVIYKMVARLLELDENVPGTRALAWAAGDISDEELLEGVI